MRRFAYLVLLAILIQLSLWKALACGGSEGSYLDQVMELSDIVVSARVDYVDALGENAILHVDRYFKGNGGEYLAVVGTRPAWFVGDALRDYTNGCYNIGAWGFKFRKDSSGYFALYAGLNGTYYYSESSVWILGDVHPSRKLKTTEGLIDIDSFIPDEYEMDHLQPAADFEKFLLKQGNRSEPSAPEPNAYPLMRYLNISTESGKQYRLNPDRSLKYLDPSPLPEAVSNDGSHVLFRLDYDELGFQYIRRIKKDFHYCSLNLCLGSVQGGGGALSTIEYSADGWLNPVKGWYARFSPDSNFVAVRERYRLVIYMFDNWVEDIYGYGQNMAMTDIGRHTLWGVPFNERSLVWSADSTTLAYQDDRGMWHWDIFEDASPRLVFATDRSKLLIDLSASGRYLRYRETDNWFLIDVESEDIYERAIATPDERNIIFVRPSYPEGTPTVNLGHDGQGWDSRHDCRAPLSNCHVSFVYDKELIDVFEYRPGWLGLVSPQSISLFPWYLSTENTSFGVEVSYEQPIAAFDYDNMYGRPAAVVGGYKIDLGYIPDLSIESAKEERSDFVDLSEHLDSPIADVEWEQPVFLDR